MVLNYNLTNIGRIHIQGTALRSLNMSTLSKMVCVCSYVCVNIFVCLCMYLCTCGIRIHMWYIIINSIYSSFRKPTKLPQKQYIAIYMLISYNLWSCLKFRSYLMLIILATLVVHICMFVAT